MSQVVLISSVLKPVTDVRSYLRLASSLSERDVFQVHVSGTASHPLPEDDAVEFHSLGNYSRRIVDRLKAHFTSFKIFNQLKPKVIIITTFELIPVAIFYKLLHSTKLVYDIQENYQRNLRYQNIYPLFAKVLLAKIVGTLHWIFDRHVSLYLLAEKCYEKELNFLHKPCIILENKVPYIYHEKSQLTSQKDERFTFIFTGTLDRETGVEMAIQWYLSIKSYFKNPQLVIIGFASRSSYRSHLKQQIKAHSDIELFSEEQPITHQAIMERISHAHVGMVCYPITLANQSKVPTKVFEYSYLGLPMLMKADTHWFRTGQQLGTTIAADLILENPEVVSGLIKNSLKIENTKQPKASLWLTEKEQFHDSILKLI